MENRLNEIFEEIDQIDDHTNNFCVNCGARLENDYTTHCNICGYDLEEPFICPYKIMKEIPTIHKAPITMAFCRLTRKQCRVVGLDYEVCSVFRSLDSIKTND